MATRAGKLFHQPEEPDVAEGASELGATLVEAPVFTLFPKFPAEIRRLIWLEAIQKDRVVEISGYETRRRRVIEVRFTSRTIVPSILHACSESRSFVTGPNLYEKLVFGGRFTGTYINYNTDIILFKRPYLVSHHAGNLTADHNLSDMGRKCRTLALADVQGLHEMQKRWAPFPNLERLVIIRPAPSYPGTDVPGDGNVVLFPLTDELVSTFGHWPSVYHKTTLERLAIFRKNNPQVRQVDLMTAVRGSERRYSAAERSERWRQCKVIETREPQKINFKGYRIVDLRHAAVERGLSTHGLKKDLVARLATDEEIRFAQAMDEYKKEHETQAEL